MKKLLVTLLAGAMLFSLAACGDNGTGGGKLPPAQSGGNGSALSTDFQQHMKTADWFKLGPMCETETGWYFQYNGLLYYIDKESVKTTVLCGKPDCKHADPTCNAWVNTSSLNYSDGKVFFDNSDNDNGASGLMTLFSMNTDGTSRKDVQALQQQKQSDWKPCEAIVHRGVVYFNYAGAVYMAPLGSDVSKATKLYGEVKNKESGTVDNGDGIYWKFSAEGDKIYFMGNINQKDGTQKDTLFCYDTTSKEFKQVWQIPDASEVGKWETTGVSLIRTGTYPCGWYIKDGSLYFYLPGNDLWRNDLNGGKNERVAAVGEKIPESGFAIFNDDNIFIVNDYPDYLESLFDRDKTKADTIFMYDYDGNLLKEFSLKDLEKHLKSVSNIQMLWASEGKLFMFVYGDTKVSDVAPNAQESSNKERLAYIDLDTCAISLLDWTGYYG